MALPRMPARPALTELRLAKECPRHVADRPPRQQPLGGTHETDAASPGTAQRHIPVGLRSTVQLERHKVQKDHPSQAEHRHLLAMR